MEAQFGISDSDEEDADKETNSGGSSKRWSSQDLIHPDDLLLWSSQDGIHPDDPRVSWRISDTFEELTRRKILEFERRCKVGLLWGIKEELQESSCVEEDR